MLVVDLHPIRHMARRIKLAEGEITWTETSCSLAQEGTSTEETLAARESQTLEASAGPWCQPGSPRPWSFVKDTAQTTCQRRPTMGRGILKCNQIICQNNPLQHKQEMQFQFPGEEKQKKGGEQMEGGKIFQIMVDGDILICTMEFWGK